MLQAHQTSKAERSGGARVSSLDIQIYNDTITAITTTCTAADLATAVTLVLLMHHLLPLLILRSGVGLPWGDMGGSKSPNRS